MYQILKNKLNSGWKTFLAESIRRYNIIFETRDIEIIRKDYFKFKWISKEELIRLLNYEEEQFIIQYDILKKDKIDLMNGFNMNAYASYVTLERQKQGKM